VTAARPTIESQAAEIERIVAERQLLRARGAGAEELERNRQELVDGQALMSRLLLDHYLPRTKAA
jgi:hypothetical protein